MHIKPSATRIVTILVAAIMILAGLYTLAVALTPAIIAPNINPTSNKTIKQLQSKAAITENRLYIPKIDVNLPYATGSETVMEKGAWWRQPDNGNPADGGNFVLSAHRFIMGLTPQQTLRKSPFYNINKLEIGDKIYIDYSGKRYKYTISKIFAVAPDAVEIEQRTDRPQLTLYSCTLGGSADGREVIVAKPLSE